MHQETQLVSYAGLNWKPVELAKSIRAVVAWAQTKHQVGSGILYALQCGF